MRTSRIRKPKVPRDVRRRVIKQGRLEKLRIREIAERLEDIEETLAKLPESKQEDALKDIRRGLRAAFWRTIWTLIFGAAIGGIKEIWGP